MKKDNSTLKSYFETGDYPTESQFVDLIDSFLNVQENNAVTGITDNGNGTYTFQLLVGPPVTLDVAQLPDDIPIASIVGLQAALDAADPDNFLRKDQNGTTTGSLSIGMASPGGGKSFSIGAQGVSSYLSMDANGNAILGNSSASDGQESHLIIKRNGGLEFSDRGTVRKVWHAGNDGSGSGLDADLLRGVHWENVNTNIVTSGSITAGTIFTNASRNANPLRLRGTGSGTANLVYLSFHESDLANRQAYIGFDSGSSNHFTIYNDTTSQYLRLLGSGGVNSLNFYDGTTGRTVWHSGNDGAGSGLDADTLDGLQLGGTTGNNGQTWGYIPFVKTDGVMEVGRIIDFHATSNDDIDYNCRLEQVGNSLLRLSSTSGLETVIEVRKHFSISQLIANASGGAIVLSSNGFNSTIIRSYGQSEFNGGDININRGGLITGQVGSFNGSIGIGKSDGAFISTGWVGDYWRARRSSNGVMSGWKWGNYDTDVFTVTTGGSVTASNTMTATNFILSSDETLKKNINDYIPRPINVQWRNFEWKNNGAKQIGVIAQELEKDHPEFVRADEGGLKSVSYIDLLVAKNAELEARIEKLEAIIRKLI